MESENLDDHLSKIDTHWWLIDQCHDEVAQQKTEARHRLMQRYSRAVRRYLRGALGDREAADEVYQEFALRLLRGDFRTADPSRGRFRDYLKTVVFHLIVDYQRRQAKQPRSLDGNVNEPAALQPSTPDAEREFLKTWREELLDRTWQTLAEVERRTGQPCHTILVFRTEHPLLSSEEMAEQLGNRLGKSFTVDGIRKALQRAREKYTELLLDEVARSLQGCSLEELEQELIDLGLLAYCQSAVNKRRGG